MNKWNQPRPLRWIMAVLLLVPLLFFATGCGAKNQPTASPGAKPETGSTESKEKPLKALLSAAGLPPQFQTGVSGQVVDTSQEFAAIDLKEPGESPSIWLVSPFFEPKSFTPALTGSAYHPAKVDLASLAKDIPPRPLKITSAKNRWQVGPFGHYGPYQPDQYSWVSETGLALHPTRTLAGLVDLVGGQSHALNGLSPNSVAVSPDNARIAYTRNGYLAVQDVASGAEKKWALTDAPETDSKVAAQMLSWSPNGHSLLGASYSPGAKPAVTKLWMLDWESGKLTGLTGLNDEQESSFGRPAWAPDGNLVVFYQNFVVDSEGYDVQWVMADLSTASTRVVVPRSSEQIEYRFSWDARGKLQIASALPGPTKTRAVGYDPIRNMSADEVYAEDYFVTTQLLFLTAAREEAFRIDLLPALEQTGLLLKDINWLCLVPVWSPDGRYLYLDGDAGKLDAKGHRVGSYRLHGLVDLSSRTARFLPAEQRSEGWSLDLSYKARWSGNQVLLAAGRDDGKVRVLDVGEMRISTLVEGQEFLAARSTDRGLVYVSTAEVGLVGPDGRTRILVSAPRGETFVPAIQQSPSGRYLAIPRERPDTDGLRWITIDVLDLSSL